MKLIKCVLLFSAVSILFIVPNVSARQEESWTGSLSDGRIIDETFLSGVLKKHEKWLLTERNEGTRAELIGANLQGATLTDANLRDAILTNVNLQEAKLRNANLQGAKLIDANLNKAILIDANLQGALLRRANLKEAKLMGANLNKANLLGVNLQKATMGTRLLEAERRSFHRMETFEGANLQGAWLKDANLQDAKLIGINLQEARLIDANLQGATLTNANLQGAWLVRTNLQGATLTNANLQDATLKGANLKDAKLNSASLQNCIYEPEPGKTPDVLSITSAKNLMQMKYDIAPHALIELRTALKKFGLRKQEREITYAVKHTGFENAWSEFKDSDSEMTWPQKLSYLLKDGNLKTLTEVSFGWFFLGLTCQWGVAPERPLGILLFFIGLFTIPYTVSIRQTLKTDGVWKVWIPERVRQDLGTKKPELIRLRGWKALKAAFYFSLLSAFNIGWRDLNVGGWIARIQPREYRMQATGWVRSVSGLQSLISVYLLALTVLTYFSRPFELY